MRWHLRAWCLAALGLAARTGATLGPSGAAGDVRRFIIVSSPRLSKVTYLQVDGTGQLASTTATDLINSGLDHPQGLAVDYKRSRLLVADPNLGKVYAYPLTVTSTGITAGTPTTVAVGIEARWVATDSVGNVFVSDESQSTIFEVSANTSLRSGATSGATALFQSTSEPALCNPGGVATDNFYVYWVNKETGTQVGSVVRAAFLSTGEEQATVVANNVVKSYGLCLTTENIYYTDDEKRIYGVKKHGGDAVEITGTLENPRGCAWDGDGTVYVADRTLNQVLSFAGNMKELAPTNLAVVAELEDAFGIAVFSSAPRRGLALAFAAFVAAALAP